jgi:hypothetical protein
MMLRIVFVTYYRIERYRASRRATAGAARATVRHLLQSAKNAETLLEAVSELDRGGGTKDHRRVRLVFGERAWGDYLLWQATDPRLLARLNSLIKEFTRTPFSGTARPKATAMVES